MRTAIVLLCVLVLIAASGIGGGAPAAPTVTTLSEEVQTYRYRYIDANNIDWYPVDTIRAGDLVILGPCLRDGFAQITYRDPARPDWWKIGFIRCASR